MRGLHSVVVGVACAGGLISNQAAEFEKPVLLKAAGEPIGVESPGYAAPCWADIDGDGKSELLVGQFSRGKIKVYQHLGDLKFSRGEWLKAEGEIAEVPGVW